MTIQRPNIYMYIFIYVYTYLYERKQPKLKLYKTLSIWDSIVYTFSMERFIVYDTQELEQKSQRRRRFRPLRTPRAICMRYTRYAIVEPSRTDFRITAGPFLLDPHQFSFFCHWFFLLPIFRHIFAKFCSCRNKSKYEE